jgi:hypothetical protein
MAALRLARFITLRVEAGIISKTIYARCIVALNVILCMGIMSLAAGYHAVHEAYACLHAFGKASLGGFAAEHEHGLFFFFEMCSLRSDEVKEASLDRYFLPLDLCGELFSKFSPLLYASSDAASQK